MKNKEQRHQGYSNARKCIRSFSKYDKFFDLSLHDFMKWHGEKYRIEEYLAWEE